MSFAKGALKDEQRRRIEANRKRALERAQKRNGVEPPSTSTASSTGAERTPAPSSTPVPTTSMNQIRNGFHLPNEEPSLKRPRVELTPEQRKRIEENRKKALEIRKNLAQNNRDATTTAPRPIPVPEGLKKAVEAQTKNTPGSKYEVPSIKRKDYIEFDFSTLTDSRGGFLNDETEPEVTADSLSLEQWKEKQKEQLIVKDLAPPIDIENAPKCFECGSLEIDPNLFTNFWQVRACRKCVKEKPEKYSLLTKTECKEDYLLTDPELRDVALLPRIEKPNPHGYSRMQLFLRFQVEQFAWKKWGSSEKLDEEWERREAMRIKRRDKKYNDQLLEMRKKTRAEEYTRKLRNGHSLGDRHVHDWSAPLSIPGEENMVKKRCIDCGVETEELVFNF
ncbi:DNA repair protein [Suhomyces tanzawaensis NRRL Y-17324]|uniref:DNA repair protein n=1 Tax=Suhomyces tanzawaensis NRRL Y-17324 TaxID=984487 RepID=A0A1E4SCB1_9ASCO|nr:DNA repair protein [Suhomyces tanzawaensis NRRL Y-17324]ODV77151.1 DNA repair protein [Suhomyces tanzawaensis NRRL Y-17324]